MTHTPLHFQWRPTYYTITSTYYYIITIYYLFFKYKNAGMSHASITRIRMMISIGTRGGCVDLISTRNITLLDRKKRSLWGFSSENKELNRSEF